MKKCSYCGRENPDDAAQCLGCGLDTFETASSPGIQNTGEHDWVFLTICPREPDAEQLQSKLKSADIEVQIPDVEEMENAGTGENESMIENGLAWIYVDLKDYPAAKKLLPDPEKQEPAPFEPGEKRVIASMEATQTGEVLKRLKLAGVPVEVKTTSDESGLETSEILVGEEFYEQGCDVVEALAEERANSKPRNKLICPNCGSQNCHSTPHIRLGRVDQCQDCGFEFLSSRVYT